MADSFQLRRIVLNYFKSSLKILCVILGLVLIAAVIIGAIAWTSPQLIVHTVRPLLPVEIRSSFSVENITGNPASGYELENLRLNFSSRTILIDSLKFNITWLPLIHGRTHIQYFNAEVEGSTVTAQGDLQLKPLFLNLTIQSRGLVNGDYIVTGSTQQWTVNAQAEYASPHGLYSGNLAAKGSGVDPLTLKADGELKIAFLHDPLLTINAHIDKSEFKADLLALNLRISTPAIDRAHISVQGSTASHHFSLSVRSNEETLEARGQGTLEGKKWTAQWTDFHLHSFGDWRNTKNFETVVNPPSFGVHNLNLSNGSAFLIFNGDLNKQDWTIFNLKIKNFNLAFLNELKFISIPLKGIATGDAVLKGPLKEPTGHMSLEINNAEIKNRIIGDITGKAKVSPTRLEVVHLRIKSDQGTILLTALIPIKKWRPEFSNIELTLQATNYNPAELLKSLTPIEIQNAVLNADLKIKRAGGTFTSEGILQLEADKVIPLEDGPELDQLVLILRGEEATLQIERGEAKSGKKGNIGISGVIDLNGPQAKIMANHFAFQWPTGISGELNADFSLSGLWEALILKGLVDIVKADYNPDKKKKPPVNKTPEDKKELKKAESDTKENNPSPLAMEVKIKFDRDVWYKQKQTSIEFSGELDIRKNPNDEAQVFGKIEVIRGAYVAYGRVFEVEEGSLLFSGRIPADPLINLKAIYIEKISKIRVYLLLTGSMSQPHLTLSSEPPLEEADIISVLATGQPLYQLGKGSGVDSQQVAQNLVASYLAEGVRQELQDIVGLDVFRVQIKDQETTDIVAGKKLSRDFYVSYGQTLGPSGEQRIEAEYDLSERWSLEGRTTSLGRYVIDLLFKFGFN